MPSEPSQDASLLFVAPTSGGKSIVAEIILLRDLLLNGRLCFCVFPTVAICDEKLRSWIGRFNDTSDNEFEDLLQKVTKKTPKVLALSLKAFYGSSHNVWTGDADVSFCTAEKANIILNRLLLDNPVTRLIKEENSDTYSASLVTDSRLLSEITTSVKEFTAQSHPLERLGGFMIDEIHEVGETTRGPTLEMLLTKLSIIKALQIKRSLRPINIIGLSGTLSNGSEIGDWLKSKVVQVKKRPVELEFYLLFNDVLYLYDNQTSNYSSALSLPKPFSVDLGPHKDWYCTLLDTQVHSSGVVLVEDGDHLAALVYENWKSPTAEDGGNALIFCPGRAWTEKVGVHLARTLPLMAISEGNETVLDSMREHQEARCHLAHLLAECVLPEAPSPALQTAVKCGIGVHHGGLSGTERRLIEEAFVNGTLRVMASTSTLAMGVNLPISRVIMRSITVRTSADYSRFHQMAGRAGRQGMKGQVIIIPANRMNNEQAAFKVATDIIVTTGCNAQSSVRDLHLARLALETFVIKSKWRADELLRVVQEHSLTGRQMAAQDFAKAFHQSIHYLAEVGCFYRSDDSSLQNLFVTGRQQLVTKRLFLCSFFRLITADRLMDSEAYFATLLTLFQQQFNCSPNSLRSELRDSLLAKRAPKATCGLMPVYSTPDLEHAFQSVTLYLTPMGQSLIESTLRIPDYFELLNSLLNACYQGLHVTSLFHIIFLSVPPSIFTQLSLTPDWSITHEATVYLKGTCSDFIGLLELLEIDSSVYQQFQRKNVTPSDVESVYKSLYDGKLAVMHLCQHRLIWTYCRFHAAMVIFCLMELQAPIVKVCANFKVSYTQVINLKRQVGITAACMASATAVLGLEQISGLMRLFASAMRDPFTSTDSDINATLNKLQTVKGQRAECLHAQGYVDVTQLAAASPDEIDLALEGLYPFNVSETEDEKRIKLARRQEIARMIKQEAEGYCLAHQLEPTPRPTIGSVLNNPNDATSEGSSSSSQTSYGSDSESPSFLLDDLV